MLSQTEDNGIPNICLAITGICHHNMVWNQHTKGNIHRIEMAHERATWYVLHRYHNRSSESEMLQHLSWLLPEVRRQHQRLAMLYKIHYGMVAINKDQYPTQVVRTSWHTQYSSYLANEATTDSIRQSFFPRTVREWNLPATVMDAPSLESFKACLARGNAKWSMKTAKLLAVPYTCTYASVLYPLLKLCHSPHWQSLQIFEVVNQQGENKMF